MGGCAWWNMFCIDMVFLVWVMHTAIVFSNLQSAHFLKQNWAPSGPREATLLSVVVVYRCFYIKFMGLPGTNTTLACEKEKYD